MSRSASLPRAAARHIGALPLAALGAVAIAFLPGAPEALQLDRAALDRGELHRLLTCHLTHWTADHLFWDAVVLAALGAWAERLDRARALVCAALAAIAIAIAVWAFTGVATYRGLSGVDSAIFALVATLVARRALASGDRGALAAAAAAGGSFLGKTLYELTTGATMFVDSAAADMVPLPLVHIVGASVGLIVGVVSGRPIVRGAPTLAYPRPIVRAAPTGIPPGTPDGTRRSPRRSTARRR